MLIALVFIFSYVICQSLSVFNVYVFVVIVITQTSATNHLDADVALTYYYIEYNHLSQ